MEIKTDQDKYSYALGYYFGQRTKQQMPPKEIELNGDIFTAAFQTAIAGDDAQLDQATTQTAFQQLQELMQKHQ